MRFRKEKPAPAAPPAKPTAAKPKTSEDKPFLLDSQDGITKDMPSITKLLNRKKLGLSSTKEPEPQPAPRPAAKAEAEPQPVPAIELGPPELDLPAQPASIVQASAPASGLGGIQPKAKPPAPAAKAPFGKQQPAKPSGAPKSLSSVATPAITLGAPSETPAQVTTQAPTPASAPSAAGTRTGIAIPDSIAQAKLELTSPHVRQPKPNTQTAVAQPDTAVSKMPGGTLAGATQIVGVQVVPSSRASRPAAPVALSVWSRSQVQSGTDPIQKTIQKLLQNGALSALFLALQETRTAPRLVASTAVGSQVEQALWKGLHWDTSWTAQIWPTVSRTGALEIRPEENQAIQGALRVAFGVQPDQWLSLLRVGNSNQCIGVLAIISSKSLQAHLTEARSQLMSASSAPQALAA